eukprot:IDg20965t1
MEMEAITCFKAQFRRFLLRDILATFETSSERRASAAREKVKARMKGVTESHDSYLLDIWELELKSCFTVSEQTIAKYCTKVCILPASMQANLLNTLGKQSSRQLEIDSDILDYLITMVKQLSISVHHECNSGRHR